MKQAKARPYSRATKDAAALLGKLIKLGRKQRKLTAADLAARAGISRGTLRRIENGDLKGEIGLVFEVAALVGLKLFDADQATLTIHMDRTDDTLSLLPKSIHKARKSVADDF